MKDIRLHRYQEETVKFMITRPAAGVFLDPGLGKTLCTYSAFQVLRTAKKAKTMLVVAPLRPLYQVWPAENEKWGFGFKVALLHGSKKAKAFQSDADVYLINYEGLDWLFGMMNQLQKTFDVIVFDESSKLRNTQTKRFKQVKAALSLFKRRFILTGTPAPKGLENLFGQIYVLDAGASLGRFVTHFRREFFDQDPFTPFPKFRLKKGADQKIYDRIAPLTIRFDDSEIDMPKRVDRTIYVDLPKAARLVYQDLESTLIAQLDENSVVIAKNAAVATHKLRQVANGGLYLNDEKAWKPLHDAKIEAVRELVDELEGKPALVAYEFHHDLERLLKAFPGTPYIGGGISPKRVQEIQAEWNQGNLELLFGQPQSMAHGMNLQEGGRASIWHSMIWNYEDYIQFVRRIWRQGQKHRVMNYHVVARNTVDEVILEVSTAAGSRALNQGQLFTALKNHMLERRRR